MPRPANPTLRNDILAVALRLIEERGVDALTMREVAGVLGYSATAIYQHFASKEDLLLTLKLQAGDLLTAVIDAARCEPTLLEQLRAMGQAYLRFGIDNPTYYRLIFQDTVVDPTPEQLLRLRTSWRIMRDTLSVWLADQQIRDVDIDQTANILWAMVHGLVSLRLANRLDFSDPHEIFTHYEVATSRWFAGLIAMHGRHPEEQSQSRRRVRRSKPTTRSRKSARRISS